ncbi:MAG TPA: hypothetical protein VFR67_00850 [Pilimelia sp.]|nr:hypothetical protein [Pilimelia sp.]
MADYGGSLSVCAYLRLTITDTLGVTANGADAFNPLARVTRTFWYRLPEAWVRGGRLSPRRREQILDQIYGPGWRTGQVDGSRYVILELQERVLSVDEAHAKPWLSDRAAFYAWREGDVIEEVIPANL